MTPAQRKTHVWTWLVLGPLLMVVVVLAAALRRPMPVQDTSWPAGEPGTMPASVEQPRGGTP